MRRWLAWAIGLTLMVGAWGVIQITPTQDDAEAPFPLAAEIDRTVTARGFAVAVTDVQLASSAVAGGWSAEGTWLIVDLEAEATREETGTRLARAELTVDGLTYRASERPPSLFGSVLTPGIPRQGSLAFEIPSDVVRRAATLELGLYDDPRLDSAVTLDLDLASLELQDEVELLETGWAKR
ncbi:hypothetical protein [Microbacterium sp. ABRD28]|uniref:hypothetical protein n=1 Tax=Microbacterium sp. ABRD28 TaxID=2268461 RepID=UPI000F54FE89|nr:hypothetical protein [Microbacterium sp. ABRD28]AZC14021.1 hypothetical protein DT073_10110 [Microbacterium sp. ABRD28]